MVGMSVPDWLWQGLTTAVVYEVGKLAWRHHDEIASRVRYMLSPGSKGFNEKATLNAVAVARISVTHDPFTGEWITSRTPFDK